MAKTNRRIRQMPKIYGNLQKESRSFEPVLRVLRGIFWLGVVLCAFYLVFFSNWFVIHKVEVQGTHFSSPAEIAHYLPSDTNLWLFSQDVLKNRILQDDRIDSVAVFRGIPDDLRILVKEKQASLLWVSGDSITVLDETGTSFVQYNQATFPSNQTELGKYLNGQIRVYDAKSLPVSLNRQIVSPIFIQFVKNIQIEVAKDLPELKLDHFEIVDTTYDVTFIGGQGMHVQFNSLADPAVQVRNLTRLVQQKKANLTSKVDLRIDRWAYVQ